MYLVLPKNIIHQLIYVIKLKKKADVAIPLSHEFIENHKHLLYKEMCLI